MAQAHVTVGVPVFDNDPVGVRSVVASVLGQTWTGKTRLIVVDDIGADDTSHALAELADTHDGVEVVRHRRPGGLHAAWETIVSRADGYLAWACVGSLWAPRKLEFQLDALQRVEADDPDRRFLCAIAYRQLDRSGAIVRNPLTGASQLHDVLMMPDLPLSALVGKVSWFREIGLERELPARQVHDFLVRFVGDGGALVPTSIASPQLTDLVAERDLDQLAVADRMLRRKHAAYLGRVDKQTQRAVRRAQLLEAADVDLEAGRKARSIALRGEAAVVAPGTVARATRQSLQPRRVVEHLSRAATRWLASLTPLLRRAGVIDLARKTGVLRGLRSSGAGLVDDVRAREEQSGSLVRRTRAELRSALASTSGEPSTWLRLEQMCREAGLLHSAELALRRGADEHPDDPVLRVRLIELLALRRKWDDAVSMWKTYEGFVKGDVSAITYARIARGMRELGDIKGSLAIAEMGLEVFPRERRLRDETYISRSASVDWTVAIRPVASTDPATVGEVTSAGFLAGMDEPVTGIVFDQSGADHVSLSVNGMEVASTDGVPSVDEPRHCEFSLRCDDLLRYVGDDDIIALESNGLTLGRGRWTVATGYPSRSAELRSELASGGIFTKFGALKTGHTHETKRALLGLYNDVSAVLFEVFGYRAYPLYGNLLGAVREHDFISHDVGGFDMGYVSRHCSAADIKAEFVDVCHTLVERGYFLRLEPWSAYVRASYRSSAHIDLNFAWFDDKDELHLSAGSRDTRVVGRDAALSPRTSVINGRVVDVPGNAEAVLSQIYGPSWHYPNQGFRIDDGLDVDAEFLLGSDEIRELEQIDPDRVQPKLEHFHR